VRVKLLFHDEYGPTGISILYAGSRKLGVRTVFLGVQNAVDAAGRVPETEGGTGSTAPCSPALPTLDWTANATLVVGAKDTGHQTIAAARLVDWYIQCRARTTAGS